MKLKQYLNNNDLKIIKILEFPDSRQSTNFSCGAACVQAVLKYYGIEIREDILIEGMGVLPTNVEPSGVRPDIILKFFEKKGLKHSTGTMTIKEITDFIDKDIPIITPIQAWNELYEKKDVDYSGWKDGHYVIAIGYTKDELIFDDPSLMNNRGFLSFDEFKNRWHDQDSIGKKYVNFGMAIFGKKPIFNPKKTFRIR
jgi:hypothetical protein